MAFAFYDFETTGTNPAFDQPLQFAAILTDDDLNEIDRVNLRCRLAPHILPSPMAMAITGVMPAMMTDPSLPSWFEFAQLLQEQIQKWSPACWTGYNSIRFDEEVLRQTFYQNLQPELFVTQLNGNQRMDILRAVQSIRMLAPEVLAWPEVAGRVSYRLDQLAPANGFVDHDAHDAIGDVLATIHIARRIRDRAPSLWSELLANRDKSGVMARVSEGRPMLLVENHFGRVEIRHGCFCGVQDGFPNSVAFFDLEAGDPANLVDAGDDAIMAAIVGRQRLIRFVAINRDPSLFHLSDPSPGLVRRAAIVAIRPDFHRRVGKAMAERYEDREEPEHIEQRIYSGFYSAQDKGLLEKFQHTDAQTRGSVLREISDERLRQLGLRILLSESPELFPDEHIEKTARAIAERWKAESKKGGWATMEQIHDDLLKASQDGLATDAQIEEIKVFLTERLTLAEHGKMPG
jgi:exodeoxyribonuclease I